MTDLGIRGRLEEVFERMVVVGVMVPSSVEVVAVVAMIMAVA